MTSRPPRRAGQFALGTGGKRLLVDHVVLQRQDRRRPGVPDASAARPEIAEPAAHRPAVRQHLIAVRTEAEDAAVRPVRHHQEVAASRHEAEALDAALVLALRKREELAQLGALFVVGHHPVALRVPRHELAAVRERMVRRLRTHSREIPADAVRTDDPLRVERREVELPHAAVLPKRAQRPAVEVEETAAGGLARRERTPVADLVESAVVADEEDPLARQLDERLDAREAERLLIRRGALSDDAVEPQRDIGFPITRSEPHPVDRDTRVHHVHRLEPELVDLAPPVRIRL